MERILKHGNNEIWFSDSKEIKPFDINGNEEFETDDQAINFYVENYIIR